MMFNWIERGRGSFFFLLRLSVSLIRITEKKNHFQYIGRVERLIFQQYGYITMCFVIIWYIDSSI